MDAQGNWAEIIVDLPTKESELTNGDDNHCVNHNSALLPIHFSYSKHIANTFHTKKRAEQMKAFQQLIRFNDEWVLRLGIEQHELFDFERDVYERFQNEFRELFLKCGNLIQL
jgi:predicted choloylglycine hydrolase